MAWLLAAIIIRQHAISSNWVVLGIMVLGHLYDSVYPCFQIFLIILDIKKHDKRQSFLIYIYIYILIVEINFELESISTLAYYEKYYCTKKHVFYSRHEGGKKTLALSLGGTTYVARRRNIYFNLYMLLGTHEDLIQ